MGDLARTTNLLSAKDLTAYENHSGEMMDQPRMHGPVTDGRIAHTLDRLRRRARGSLREAILLLEAVQYERQEVRRIAGLVSVPRRDWTEEMLRSNKQPGIYGDQESE